MDHVAAGSEDGSIKVLPVYETVGTWNSSVSGVITCIAVPPSAADRVDEIAVGYEPGIFSLVRKARPSLSSECMGRCKLQ